MANKACEGCRLNTPIYRCPHAKFFAWHNGEGNTPMSTTREGACVVRYHRNRMN